MEKKIKNLSLFLFLLFSQLAFADPQINQTDGSGIIYGNNHAYLLSAPHGWVMDVQSGKPDGIPVVFYPKGKTWKDATTVLYSTVTQKPKGAKVEDIIDLDVHKFTKAFPEIKVYRVGHLTTKTGRKASLLYFHGAAPYKYEAVAYIDEPQVVTTIVLNSSEKKDFDLGAAPLKALVKSYEFVKK